MLAAPAAASSSHSAHSSSSDGERDAVYVSPRASRDRLRVGASSGAEHGAYTDRRSRDGDGDEDDDEDNAEARRELEEEGHKLYGATLGVGGPHGRGEAWLDRGGRAIGSLGSAAASVADLALGPRPTSDEQERRRAYWRAAVLNVALILSWYFFSTLMNLYNSWLFSRKHHAFSYPLFVTSCHMAVQFGLSLALLSACQSWVPRGRNGKRLRPSSSDWATKVVPCAVATALDIGLSNLSLKTITLTFYTMCKSSNLAFVLFFAFLFGLEKVRLSLIGVIALITVGVIMMVAAETEFVFEGAVEVLSASACGGLRWALTQILLDREGMGMSNPVATIFWLAPVMFVSMLSVSVMIEDWPGLFSSKFFGSLGESLKTLALVMAPGFVAFAMNLSEFALIRRTSVVTLSVAGIFKEASTILLSSSVFGDRLTPVNVSGLIIALLGIGLYNYLKYRLLVVVGAGASGGEPGGAYEPLARERGGAPSSLGDHSRRHSGEAEAMAEDDGSLAMSERDEVLSEAELERRRKRDEEAELSGGGTWKTGQGFFEDSDEE